MIDALGKREYRRFNAAMAAAVANTTGVARLEAAIEVAAAFLQDQPPRDLIDLDPGFVNEQVARVLPMMTAALTEVLTLGLDKDVIPGGADPVHLAAAVARTALSHYVFPDLDPAAARLQMRAAAGLNKWLGTIAATPASDPICLTRCTSGPAPVITPPGCVPTPPPNWTNLQTN